MKKIVCEMCGCNEMIKQDGFFICQAIAVSCQHPLALCLKQ